ncbi:exonuclease 1 [Thraustotheca clavata]|uniref:Exonuclease 1 n=1 Tax=Thraustotheca clavata TaxID=74557 RepID=A0A1V9ZBX7_9STRA|nr:exonuclease 1 [Thraustotheca clavata]
MGITNLLPQLKSITTSTTLENYRGKTVAVDGYCWLHRGVYSCSQELCLGQETNKYVKYFMDRVEYLLTCGIVPYIVFDGGYLPMKKLKEEERRSSREKHRESGLQYLENKNYEMARQSFIKAVDVSPLMAHRVIQCLKKRNVKYIVAPYEADAQMAYLARNGLVDAVISEDSDCLPFGCHTVLFKMDQVGNVDEIVLKDLANNKALSFVGFSDDMFLDMCILSGCDYVASIPGLGVKKSHGLLQRYGSWKKVVRSLRLEGKLTIAKSYEEDFERARLTFRHQRVYDPTTQTLVNLTPLESPSSEMDFLGPIIPDSIAKDIAEGNMDPITQTPFPVMPMPTCQPKLIPFTIPRDATRKPLVKPAFISPEANKENAFTRMLSAAGNSLVHRSAMKRKQPFADANVNKWMYKKPLNLIDVSEAAKNSRFFKNSTVVSSPPEEMKSSFLTPPDEAISTSEEVKTLSPIAKANTTSMLPKSTSTHVKAPRTLFDHFRFQAAPCHKSK